MVFAFVVVKCLQIFLNSAPFTINIETRQAFLGIEQVCPIR